MSTSVPVIEQIAQKIAERLRTVTTVTQVIRPKRRNDYSPSNGTAVLQLQAIEDGEPEINSSGIRMNRVGVWTIEYFVEPSDQDDSPLDRLQALAIAEIERALAEDFYLDGSSTFAGPGGFAGIGHAAHLRAPQIVVDADGKSTSVQINLAVGYAHSDRDPFTPM